MGTLPLTCPCCSTKGTCEHTFPIQKEGLPPYHFSCLGLLLFIHLMKPNHFAPCCYFSCRVQPGCVSLWAWMTSQAYLSPIYFYGRKTRVLLCVCACSSVPVWKSYPEVGGGLWHASLVWGFRQQKSILLYGAACSDFLQWVEGGSTGPASCFMHLHAA